MNRDSDNLKIQRRHPRTDVDIDCMVGPPAGGLATVRILNLSEGGLKFACNRNVTHGILPEERRTPGTLMDIEAEMRFELAGTQDKAVVISCTVLLIHFERLAQDSFHFGVQFREMDEPAKKALQDFLSGLPQDD